jgi:hypothetical protein
MGNVLCDLRFSQLFWWRFQSSITQCCVKWYLVTDGLEERAAFILRLGQEEYGLHSEAANPTETITNYQSTQCNNPHNYNLQQKYKFITYCSYINGSHTSYFIVFVLCKEVSWTNHPLHISLKLITLPPTIWYCHHPVCITLHTMCLYISSSPLHTLFPCLLSKKIKTKI